MIPQRRRRRGMLLALFVFFFIIFLFDTPTEQSESEKEKEVEAQLRDEKKREVPSIFKEEELDALKRILGNLESGTKYPAEITGEFSGEWGGEVDESLKESLLTPKDDLEKTSDENVRIVAGLPSWALERKEREDSFDSCVLKSDSKKASAFSLYIYSSPTQVSGISWLRARIRLESTIGVVDDEKSHEVDAYMIGIYVRPFGEIALFPSVANISVSITSSARDKARRRRILLPADLLRYREKGTGNTRVEALTLVSQDSSSSSHEDGDKDFEKSALSKAVPCMFQLHLSLDSIDTKSHSTSLSSASFDLKKNVFDEEDGHYVQCSGELYDLDSNATISVQKVTSYLYVHVIY